MVGTVGEWRTDLFLIENREPRFKNPHEMLERIGELETLLERIGWHELSWKEARDLARAALAERES